MKKILAALCMIVLFCIVFLSISGCTEEEKTEEANQSNYGKQQCFEHNFGTYLVEIAPTCTEKGIESAYCAVCGEKSVREIQPLGHDLEGLPCEGRHCSRCEYTEAPTAHVYELIEEIPADCLYAGIKIYSCECGESYTEEVPASGHSFGEWQASTPSTCIKEGVEKRVCERCLAEETRSLPLAEHDFGEWTATKEPDCTESGSQERICSVCHTTETAEIPAVGHKHVLVEERSATCAENGKKIFECSVCHDIKEEITEDKLNHDFGDAAPCAEGVTCISCGKERLPLPHSHATREIEPTCTESGYSEEYCTECGKIFAKIEKAEPSGHDFCEWRLVKAPTCMEPGTEERVCRNCGHAETRIAEAAGHDFGEALPCEEGVGCIKCGAAMPTVPHTCATRGKDATCTESGYTETYCTVCGKVIGDRTESAALGHDLGGAAACAEGVTCVRCGAEMLPAPHSHAERSVAPTCTAGGFIEEYCTECGKIFEKIENAEPSGHDFCEWTVTKEPDCTESGSQERICSVCHTTETAEIPAVGHKHVLVEERSATCAENGKKIFECSVCHDIKEEITEDKLDHDFGEALPCEERVVCIKCGAAMPTVPHTCATRGKEATCTESGYTETYCTVCGKVIGERTESAALGHDFGEWETDIAATCVAEGAEKRVCIRCGISETRAIPVTEHEWEEVFVLPATETSEGKTTYECSICHAEKEETIPKIEHVHDYDYVSIYGVGVACSCGRVNANEGNVIIDSSNTVSGICEGSGGVIVVPNTAYAVKWESVFCYNSQIEYIYFGENITAIDNLFAFEGCDNLKAIYVSSECSIPVVPDFWPDMEIIRVDYNS